MYMLCALLDEILGDIQLWFLVISDSSFGLAVILDAGDPREYIASLRAVSKMNTLFVLYRQKALHYSRMCEILIYSSISKQNHTILYIHL